MISRICSQSAITNLKKKIIFISCTILLILEHCVKPGWDTLGEGYSCVLGQRLDAEGNGQNDFTFRLRYLFAWVRPPSWEPNATHFESWTERISILLEEEEEGSFGSKLAKWKGDHYEKLVVNHQFTNVYSSPPPPGWAMHRHHCAGQPKNYLYYFQLQECLLQLMPSKI